MLVLTTLYTMPATWSAKLPAVCWGGGLTFSCPVDLLVFLREGVWCLIEVKSKDDAQCQAAQEEVALLSVSPQLKA